MGAPGEIWWNGENYYYFAWLYEEPPGGVRNTWVRMYRIDSMPSISHNVKKGSIIASEGWRFCCTYFKPGFSWTAGRGLNGGRSALYWQKAFVFGIQRYRGVDAQTGRDHYVYDYDENPPNWEGRPQVAYPTNAVGNLENHNNGINYNRRHHRWRLNTTFVYYSYEERDGFVNNHRVCICVGQLWRRGRIPAYVGDTINGGPIKAVKYWRSDNGVGWTPERRNYETFSNGPYIHGNDDRGKEVMVIDILGFGNQGQDLIFYATFGIGDWAETRNFWPDINEPNRDYAEFNNRKIYVSIASEFNQLFNIARRPNERQTNQTARVRLPIRRQNANSMEVEDANNNNNNNKKPAAIPPLAERLQAVRWNGKEWGYGADFIKWNERKREYHADLTGDSSGSGSSEYGVDPNHPHQRAKATSEPERPRQTWHIPTEHYVYTWKLHELPNELRMEWRLHRENTPRIPIRIGDKVIRKEGDNNWDPNPELTNRPYFPQPDTITLVQAGAGIGGVNLYQLESRGQRRGMYDAFSIAKLIMPSLETKRKRERWARVKRNMQWGLNKEMFKAKIKF